MAHSLKSLFVLNIISIVASLVYFFVSGPSIYANVYGLILILTLTSNILAATFIKQKKKWRFSYLLLSSFGLLIVIALNTVTSLDPANHSSQSLLSIGLMLLLLVIGTIVTGKTFNYKQSLFKNNSVKMSRFNKSYRKTKVSILSLFSFLLFIGGLLALAMLMNIPVGLIEAGLSPYSLFYSLIFLSISGISLNLVSVKNHPIITYTLGAFGLGLYILFALPFLSIPSMLNEAEENYTEAFGKDWKTFDDTVAEFRDVPISLPAFFFGSPSDNYKLHEDVLFYEGTEGVDEGLKLRYDAYTPPENAKELPGEGSVLIRIHGGGWGTGDKGAFNFSQINKYFASQGYTVFDVQYGLDQSGRSAVFLSGPDDVYGTFSIDDMVRHLGIFTTYLADNSDEYGANMDSVFISGGSAGGQLANALALTSFSDDYNNFIDPRITVKGLIPLYPANNLSKFRNIGGKDELVDPALLVEENSPPTLVFQGDRDTIVDPQVATNFKDAYLKENNEDIAIIGMPYGAHISDVYFSGMYNQTFMYYMERFMYQYK